MLTRQNQRNILISMQGRGKNKKAKKGSLSARHTGVKRNHKTATREKILAAAKKVFAQHPYSTASIRMVGKTAEIDHPLISYYFPTKAELYEGALARRIFLMPIATMSDILQSPQLKERNFWFELEHPELGNVCIKYPGQFVRALDVVVGPERRAPLVGEHNEEIYRSELGLSIDDITKLKSDAII